ncbi:DUF2177 family protein [Alteromonas halophila]|uniref:Membrane protein n=1 Tax=Alteromonas halophila TaxID=516698 RepID=A0A918JP10_9ALTE|nr:DUF2177 family protein [Alteromonas halophila]GGW91224.1 membrane protein [Alteromonas halophila]
MNALLSRATLIAYITVLLLFAVLDGIWLGIIAMPWYQDAFAGLLREPFITWPWMVFYLAYCLIVVVLAVCPGRHTSVLSALGRGAMLGAAAYGTYNLTGYSIIAGWPLNMTLVDLAWGTVATALLSTAGRAMINRFGKQ